MDSLIEHELRLIQLEEAVLELQQKNYPERFEEEKPKKPKKKKDTRRTL